MALKLITDLTPVTANVPVNMTSDFDVVKPFLSAAETMYVARLIGKDQYDALVAFSLLEEGGEGAPNANQAEAITLCQRIIANLGYYMAVPVLSVSIGSSGIQIASNQDTKQAFQWQVEDLKNALLGLGFGAIEDLLSLLDDNPNDFQDYGSSAEGTRNKDFLIKTAAEFSNYYQIGGSRFIFQSIAYLMKRIEQQSLVSLVGDDFLQSLKDPEADSAKKKLLNNYFKPGLALLTVAKAIIERVITLENGQVAFNFRGNTENMNMSQAATNQQIKDMAQQLTDDGNQYIKDGMDYINTNLTDFDDFNPPTPKRRFRVANDSTKPLFIT
jgi:hypothetical protein